MFSTYSISDTIDKYGLIIIPLGSKDKAFTSRETLEVLQRTGQRDYRTLAKIHFPYEGKSPIDSLDIEEKFDESQIGEIFAKVIIPLSIQFEETEGNFSDPIFNGIHEASRKNETYSDKFD